MRTLRAAVILNNLPSSWDMVDVPTMLEAVREFYAPVVDIQFVSIEKMTKQPVLNATYEGLAPLAVVDDEWYDENVSISHLQYDLLLFVTPRATVPPFTYAGYMSSANCGPWECTVFVGEPSEHAYVNGRDWGSSFVLYATHEIAHALYYMLNIPDRTHVHFPVGQDPYSDDPKNVLYDLSFPDLTLQQQLAEWARKLAGALVALNIIERVRGTTIADEEHEMPAPKDPSVPASDALLWDTKEHVRHSIRVMCDNAGISFSNKNIITACIYQESAFNPKAENHANDNGTSDYGLCQYNTGKSSAGHAYWIGAGAAFSSVEEVLSSLEKNVRVMIDQFKAGGYGKSGLLLWSSFKTGAYKRWLPYVTQVCPESGYPA